MSDDNTSKEGGPGVKNGTDPKKTPGKKASEKKAQGEKPTATSKSKGHEQSIQ